jgi:hypothetical protein
LLFLSLSSTTILTGTGDTLSQGLYNYIQDAGFYTLRVPNTVTIMSR